MSSLSGKRAVAEGTWECVGIVSGDSPAQNPGWYYGDWAIDDAGNMTTETPMTDALGNDTYVPQGGTLVVDAKRKRIVTLDPDPGARFRGVMDPPMSIIVSSATMAPGDVSDVSGFNLLLWVKKAGTFTQTDLEGLWECVGIVSGDAPAQKPGWYYGNWAIDGAGSMSTTTPVTDALGNHTHIPQGGTVLVSADGIVTLEADPGVHFRGVMDPAKNIIVASATMAPGDASGVSGFNLLFWVRKVGTFTQTNLQGVWECVGIVSGDAPAQRPGWYYGNWVIDGVGNMSTTTPVTDALGNHTYIPQGGTVLVSADGIVTLEADPGVHFRGVMDPSKNIIVASATMAPGDVSDVSGFNLVLWVKR